MITQAKIKSVIIFYYFFYFFICGIIFYNRVRFYKLSFVEISGAILVIYKGDYGNLCKSINRKKVVPVFDVIIEV